MFAESLVHYGLCFANLLMGLALGWCVGAFRSFYSRGSRNENVAVAVAAMIDRLRATTDERESSWPQLRRLLSDASSLTDRDLSNLSAIHRLFGDLMGAYADNIQELDPKHSLVAAELLKDIVSNRTATTSFANELAQLDREDVGRVVDRLAELEKSNQDLKVQLESARHQVVLAMQRVESAESAALHDVVTGLPPFGGRSNRACRN